MMRAPLISLSLLFLVAACGDSPLPPEKDAQGATDRALSFLDLGDGFVPPDGADDVAVNDAAVDISDPPPDAGPDADPCGGCPDGLDCVSGSCRCISGGNCRGCCASTTLCVDPPTPDQCGASGSTCTACPVDRANLCIASGTGHCACSGPTYPGPSLPPMCGVGERCDTSVSPPVCVAL